MKRSLILGGTGALGLAVAKSLRSAGHEVHVTASNGEAARPCSTLRATRLLCSGHSPAMTAYIVSQASRITKARQKTGGFVRGGSPLRGGLGSPLEAHRGGRVGNRR